MRHKPSQGRADMAMRLIRGRPYFTRYTCALVITRPCADGRHVVFHIETFAGYDGRTVRAEAARRFRAIRSGVASTGLRNVHLTHNYSAAGLLFPQDVSAA